MNRRELIFGSTALITIGAPEAAFSASCKTTVPLANIGKQEDLWNKLCYDISNLDNENSSTILAQQNNYYKHFDILNAAVANELIETGSKVVCESEFRIIAIKMLMKWTDRPFHGIWLRNSLMYKEMRAILEWKPCKSDLYLLINYNDRLLIVPSYNQNL